MDRQLVERATTAVVAAAIDRGLVANDVTIVQNSTKVSMLVVPCDVFARVAPISQVGQLALEVDLAQRFASVSAPAVALDPRFDATVQELDDFAVTWWTFHDTASTGPLGPAAYAETLQRLHSAMRGVDIETPHFLDRVAEAEHLVRDESATPELDIEGRALLQETFADFRDSFARSGHREQLLHGEPHPGNVLNTAIGPLFIDLETSCRGPVAFDLAHVPRAVSSHYRNVDQELVEQCRKLVLAMIAAWRWDADDEFPNRLHHGRVLLDLLRQGPPWPTIGEL